MQHSPTDHTDTAAAKTYWDHLHCSLPKKISYDDWLDPFADIITRCPTPIIDLGCGNGNNTKYLMERGKRVIACDLSPNAIQNIRLSFPTLYDAKCFDMSQGLPFDSGITALVIADLSLHYFTAPVTDFVLREIRRVLTPNGILLARVNSVKDVHHGAGQGVEVERHCFRTPDGRLKRFFDEKDCRRFFGDWHILDLQEDQMTRYALPKQLWVIQCRAHH